MNEWLYAIIFYVVFSLFGIIGYTALIKVNNKNRILKYIIAKPLGLLIFAYPVWLLSSFHILKFNSDIQLYFLFFLALITSIGVLYYYSIRKRQKNLVQKLKNTFKRIILRKKEEEEEYYSIKFIRGIIGVEVISMLLFFGYLYIRAFQPNLEGTEKFMDLLMYSSAGKTDYFPFKDPWLPSKPVNYYYYGFYLFALVTRLAQVPYSIGYNLTLGIIFVYTAIISFAIVYKLTKSYLFSSFGAGLVTVAGNAHYAACLYQNFNRDIGTKCYYPGATRLIDPSYTINEFPSYSFVLGDLHPHVMSLPFLLTNIYLLTLIYKSKKINNYLFGLFGLSLATSALINTWDFIALGFLFFLILVLKITRRFKNYVKNSKEKFEFRRDLTIEFVKKYKFYFIWSILLAISPFVLFFPFFMHFQSPVTGIGFAPEFYALNAKGADYQYPSTFWFLAGIWGFYIATLLISLAILGLTKYNFKKTLFPYFLGISGFVLVLFTELFFFEDLFHIANPPYFRANTVFKFGYIAWVFFGLGTAALYHHIWKSLRTVKSIYAGIFLDFLIVIGLQIYAISVFAYPFVAVKQAYNPAMPQNIVKENKTFTLDGSKYIKTKEIDDYNTIQYINSHFKERKVITEAVGGSYTYYARISVNTGMMNPVNWPSHEWTWRFHYPEDIKSWKDALGKSIETGYGLPAGIEQDVKKIYESDSKEETQDLLNKYNVDYIYIGNLERTTYSDLKEDKLRSLGTEVYSSGNSVLLKVK